MPANVVDALDSEATSLVCWDKLIILAFICRFCEALWDLEYETEGNGILDTMNVPQGHKTKILRVEYDLDLKTCFLLMNRLLLCFSLSC